MSNFYYVKLSCPKEAGGNFFNIVSNSIRGTVFKETLFNIPNKLSEAEIGDFVMLQLGGDIGNKKRYFPDNLEFSEFKNGWYAVGLIEDISIADKEFSAKFYPFKKSVTKLDLYPYPQFIDNIGCTTKGTPNQAGLYEIEESVALSFVEYLLINDLSGEAREVLESVSQKNVLKNSAENFYQANRQLIEMNSYPIADDFQLDNLIVEKSYLDEFVEWFIEQDNLGVHKYYTKYCNDNTENLRKKLREYENIYREQFDSNVFTTDGTNTLQLIEELEENIYKDEGGFFDYSAGKNNHMPRAILGAKNYIKFLKEYKSLTNNTSQLPQINFKWNDFLDNVNETGLIFSDGLIKRFIAALQTKPFVILTGLSGSGKTKLAEAFSNWVSEFKEQQVCMVAVGADWTNREPLLGFPNALESGKYVKPESGALDLILAAQNDPSSPYFLILDEMNMSHVERYFSDFLSAMESVDSLVPLHSGKDNWDDVPPKVTLPKNLFIIGTVNVDETTYMFSPKVLDRANVIEFRVSKDEMSSYFKSSNELNMEILSGGGANMAQSFVSDINTNFTTIDLGDILMPFFNDLQEAGAEFGYRSASEINRFVGIFNNMSATIDTDNAIDAAIMQKLLPKLHGSRNKLEKILRLLAVQCMTDSAVEEDFVFNNSKEEARYPISYEKLQRMHKRIIADGFTSFAEA